MHNIEDLPKQQIHSHKVKGSQRADPSTKIFEVSNGSTVAKNALKMTD